MTRKRDDRNSLWEQNYLIPQEVKAGTTNCQ